jgi:hypothetical protein
MVIEPVLTMFLDALEVCELDSRALRLVEHVPSAIEGPERVAFVTACGVELARRAITRVRHLNSCLFSAPAGESRSKGVTLNFQSGVVNVLTSRLCDPQGVSGLSESGGGALEVGSWDELCDLSCVTGTGPSSDQLIRFCGELSKQRDAFGCSKPCRHYVVRGEIAGISTHNRAEQFEGIDGGKVTMVLW